MARFSDKEILRGLKNGSAEVLFYLSDRFFQSSRRWLRTKGIRDADTPSLFSDALIRLMRDVQHKNVPEQLQPGTYLSTVLRTQLKDHKLMRSLNDKEQEHEKQMQRVAACYSILEDQSRQILSAYYADRMNFEEIAARFDFGNPVIAEVEVNKAMQQLETLVKARLSIA
ncbi:MAG: hypothetical protein RIQ47_1301 [Bacteroidota bacterium]|jgi:DNA-directed RNA polymerase specialized sigma24 family protein